MGIDATMQAGRAGHPEAGPAPVMTVQAERLAQTPLDRLAACAALLAGVPHTGALPPLWHWLLFLDAPLASELGADGHRAHGAMLPHDTRLPSRMWAGGRVCFTREASIGTMLRRRSAILHVRDKQGRGGALRVVTLRHSIEDTTGLLIEEEQDLLFREASPAPPASPAAEAPSGAIVQTLTPDAVLLFRFSALTFNAHRIHYDRDYARSAEHYPDLVVHGPLQALLLAALLHRARPSARLLRFDFRSRAPAFAGEPLTLEAWPDPARQSTWHLRTRNAAGAACMTAQAELGEPATMARSA